MLGSIIGIQGSKHNGLAIAKVYDQEKFIQKRNDKIVNLKQEAKGLNEIAMIIHDKVEDQGVMLDALNKDLEKGVSDVKKGNKQLLKAQIRAKKNTKNSCCIIAFIIMGLLIIGITLSISMKVYLWK